MKKIIIMMILVLYFFTLASCENNLENKKVEIENKVTEQKIEEVKLTPEENKLVEEVVEPLLNDEIK